MTGVFIIWVWQKPFGASSILCWFKILRLAFSLILNFSNYYNVTTCLSSPEWKKKKKKGLMMKIIKDSSPRGKARLWCWSCQAWPSVALICFISCDCWVRKHSPCPDCITAGAGEKMYWDLWRWLLPVLRIRFCNYLPK